jgi:diguanylate cyclase (GGDEF)-like protein
MASIPWRAVIGPVITLAAGVVVLVADRHLFPVPNPGAISFLAVAFSAYVGGLGPGLVSAAVSFGFATVHLSQPGELFQFTPDNFARLAVLTICTPAIAVMIGVLQTRVRAAFERERAAHREVTRLRAALDQSEVGVVLLDSEMRAQFINRAFRRLWRLPDAIADRKPAFVGLMYHGRQVKAFAMPEEQIDRYIAERTALVRAGDEKPVDMRLAGGDVIRCRCKVLVDGGRMLTYGNVSDLVRSADEYAELAITDALTGIYNRRHFMTRFESEWNRYLRYGRPLSLLMLDIDLFKSVNDRYGHDVGDRVIVHVARLCEAQTRNSDLVARIGGEEFAILLPESDLEEARVVAERLRGTLAEQPLPDGEQVIAVTISIGVAQADTAMAGLAELSKRADEALYAAKRGGRNRVETARVTAPAGHRQLAGASAGT